MNGVPNPYGNSALQGLVVDAALYQQMCMDRQMQAMQPRQSPLQQALSGQCVGQGPLSAQAREGDNLVLLLLEGGS